MSGKFEREIKNRAVKLGLWLEMLDERYNDLLSRSSETDSLSGFDDKARVRPCECRLEWKRGDLCLACDNTRWRPATNEERADGMGIDPYAADLERPAVVAVESASSRRRRNAERIDAIIEGLRRDTRIRAGVEVPEGRDLRNLRIVSRRTRDERRILEGLELLRTRNPSLYEELPSERSLCALALLMYKLVPGRIAHAPSRTNRKAA